VVAAARVSRIRFFDVRDLAAGDADALVREVRE
jgi:hypothetical protein